MLQDSSGLKPNVICEPFLGNSPLWSLSYEWWFYMVYFLLFKCVKQKTKASKAIYSIGIISALSYIFYPNFFNRELMYMVIWWIGADLANLYINKDDITFKKLNTQFFSLGLIIIILVLNVYFNKGANASIGISPILELRHFCFAIAVLSVMIIWKNMNWIGFNASVGLFKFVSPISFSIYISHWFLVVQGHYLDAILVNNYSRYFLMIFVCLVYSYIMDKLLYPILSTWLLNKLFTSNKNRNINSVKELHHV